MKKLAFVFPGQGSQSVGMLAEIAAEFPVVEQTFAEASSVLDYDLWQLTQEGPAEKLNKTEYTQPALLAAGIAVWRVWQAKHGLIPSLLAGHSLGEYTALAAANAILFTDAIKLVRERGKAMQDAAPEGRGSMAAIVGLSEEKVLEICQKAKENNILSPANYNSIGQIVLAGETKAIERAVDLAKKMGAKIAKILPVSIPSHCELMRPAASILLEKLKQVTINKPSIPILHNADVKMHTSADGIREALTKQLYSAVKWTETIQEMQKLGINCIFECGPGKILSGLNKRIVSDIVVECLSLPANLDQALSYCLT